MRLAQTRLFTDEVYDVDDVVPGGEAVPASSVWREGLEEAIEATWSQLRCLGDQTRYHLSSRTSYVHADALSWMELLPSNSIHAIVTDPPYGLIEYSKTELDKRSSGKGGVWRIPPSFDGAKRAPLPRFTVLSADDTEQLRVTFTELAVSALRVLAPGGHLIIASNPLLSTVCFYAFQSAGFEKRGEIIRQVQTLRGGDRPKGAEDEFPGVSVMPRSCWEPWGVFRKPIEGTVATNLKRWGTGGLRRISDSEPFKDMICCSPTRKTERDIAPHPSLKPQRFMRKIVRAALPLCLGIIYDPFAGSGATLASAEYNGYRSIGTDRAIEYVDMGRDAFTGLLNVKGYGG